MREVIKIEKKTRILDAAALLFSRRQYHEVMIEDVAKLASMAKGTVYNYFSSKEELYFSIMLERMDTLITSLTQKIQSNPGSKDALESYVIHLYMFMMKYRDFFLMYRKETLKAENQLCSAIAKMQKQLKNMLKEIINSGIEAGIFRNVNTGFAADLIIGNIYAAVDRGIEKNYSDKYMVRERSETFNFIYEGMSAGKESFPLAGRRIILTRTEEQNRDSAGVFESAGAEVISLPMIRIAEIDNGEEFERNLALEPDYIVFTSASAVRIFSGKLTASGIAVSRGSVIVAVGDKTAAECAARGLRAELVPSRHSAEGLAELFADGEIKDKKFLIPRSASGRSEFIDYLTLHGAVPLVMDIYETAAHSYSGREDYLKQMLSEPADAVVFASPSAFINFVKLSGQDGDRFLRSTCIASIGQTTGRAITERGYSVTLLSAENSMEGIRRALVNFYKKEKN